MTEGMNILRLGKHTHTHTHTITHTHTYRAWLNYHFQYARIFQAVEAEVISNSRNKIH